MNDGQFGPQKMTGPEIIKSNKQADGIRNCHSCIHLYPVPGTQPQLADRLKCAKYDMFRGVVAAKNNPVAYYHHCKEVSPSVAQARARERLNQ